MNTYRLGITMAGAVSAGAYTAGVVDYLLEALNAWQKEKDAGNPDTPRHEVRIEALGGASAGGIATALTACSFYSGIEHIHSREEGKKKFNLLYDAWVNLADDKDSTSIYKLLDSADLDSAGEHTPVLSLLNSRVIDAIADRAIALTPKGKKQLKQPFPTYIAPDFELVLTLCSLRGLPLSIDFKKRNKRLELSHNMAFHRLVAHLQYNTAEDSPYALRLDCTKKSDVERLIHFAKATAAFPIGLAPRDITGLRNDYLAEQLRFFNNIEFDEQDVSGWPPEFRFLSIDGGTFNNEPFGELATIMEKRDDKTPFDMLLIDPFPNFSDKTGSHYEAPQDILGFAPAILKALRNQGMVKEHEFSARQSAVTHHNAYNRWMIFPSRHDEKRQQVPNPIACGSLSGFGGFLHRSFREHDFFLGRRNCRNFLWYIFSKVYPVKDFKERNQKIHAIHRDWTDAMVDRFGRLSGDGKYVILPVIPDPQFEIFRQQNNLVAAGESAARTLGSAKVAAPSAENAFREWTTSIDNTSNPFPGIRPENILDISEALCQRIEKMIRLMLHQYSGEKDAEHSPKATDPTLQYLDQLAEKAVDTNRFAEWLFTREFVQGFIRDKGSDVAVRALAVLVLKSILRDLHKNELLLVEKNKRA